MLTRRQTMLASAILAGGALPADAQQPRHATQPKSAVHGAKKDAPTGSPADTPIGPVDTLARWAIIQDFDTGAVLLDKNADDQMPPSSMTKLMTIYLVYERLKQGKLKLDDQVSVEDLIRGIIVDSGNDACIVLAEAIAGSEEQFVEMMNKKAKELGLTNTYFKTSTGWPDPEQHMSCRDIATLAGRIIRDFPQYYHYDAEKTFKYNNIEQENRNPLVQKGTADGLKTGHTEAGGYGLVASTKRGERRVILVLNGLDSMHARAEEGERLMDWAFANFEDVTLFAAGDVVERVPVWLGTSPTVPLVGGRALVVTMPRNWRNNASVKVSYDAPIRAPVEKGTTLGKLVVAGSGVPGMEVPLLAGEDVPRLSLPGRAMAVLSHYVTGG